MSGSGHFIDNFLAQHRRGASVMIDVEEKKKKRIKNNQSQRETRKRKAKKMMWYEMLKDVSGQLVATWPGVEEISCQPGDRLATLARLFQEMKELLDQEPQPKRRPNAVKNGGPALGGEGQMPPSPPLDIDAAQHLPRMETRDFGMEDTDGL